MGLDRKMMAYSQLDMDAKSERQLYEKLLEQLNEGGVSGEFKGSNIQIVDAAETPQFPILPLVQRDLMMSAAGGLILALALAFRFEYFDSRIKSPDEVKAHLELPFLGMIPAVTSRKRPARRRCCRTACRRRFRKRSARCGPPFCSHRPTRAAGRSSSPVPGPHEGKTLVSSSTAITLAQAGQKTLVIDADMPPAHARSARPPADAGLSNMLVGTPRSRTPRGRRRWRI